MDWPQKVWDLGCLLSIFGIWPRYIEPELLSLTRIPFPVDDLPSDLENFRIAQFSDLHLSEKMTDRFLDRTVEKIMKLQPDIIVFTGDFICYSKIGCPDRLKAFLDRFSAPCGCFAVLGNHDYEKPVLANQATGDYDAIARTESNVSAGLKLLFKKPSLTGKVTESAANIGFHPELMDLLKTTPFQVLHNEQREIAVKTARLNIVGLGEHMLGRAEPKKAFENIDGNWPTITLAHNPDAFPALSDWKTELVLCGHTHGGQINLPGLWNRFTLLENPRYKRGLIREKNQALYVNRGIGSVFKFRLCSVPEITLIELKDKR